MHCERLVELQYMRLIQAHSPTQTLGSHIRSKRKPFVLSASCVKLAAELQFASDDAGYVDWTLERLMAHPAFAWAARCSADWKTHPPGWPQTRYEAKALHGPPAYLLFVRRSKMAP
jgi:tRNA G46 methylase TrmB